MIDYSISFVYRLPGFRLSIKVIMVLLLLSGVGLLSTGYTKYTGKKVDVSFYHSKALHLAKPGIDKIKGSYKWIDNKTAPYVKAAKIQLKKITKWIKDIAYDFSQHVKVLTTFCYSKACIFADWLVTKLLGIAMHVTEQFNTVLRRISKYFPTSDKQER